MRFDMRDGLSDKNMLRLFRSAVLIIHQEKCFFCGARYNLEIHHYVKRKSLLLRYDWRNGIPVCKYSHIINQRFKMSCHQYAETPMGKHLIDEYLVRNNLLNYLAERNLSSKQYFVDRGITRKEYLIEIKKELEDIISETKKIDIL